MPAPTVILPITGTDPKVTTTTDLQDEINTALEANHDNIEAHKASMGALATKNTIDGDDVDDGTIGNGKLADMSQAQILGRGLTAGTGKPTYLSATQVSTLLELGDLATKNKVSGADIDDATIWNQKLSPISQYAVKGRTSAGVGEVESVYVDALLEAVVGAATAKTDVIWSDVLAILDSEDSDSLKSITAVDLRDYMISALAATFQGKTAALDGTEESFTTALKAKLDAIASGATVNDTDANLLNRANHTGTQLAATISDLGELATKDKIMGEDVGDGQIWVAKLGNIAQYAFHGRLGAGTGPVEALTRSQAQQAMNVEDGADVTDTENVGSAIYDATEKTSLVWGDRFGLLDSEDSFSLKRVTLSDLRDYMISALAATFQGKTAALDGTEASFTTALKAKLDAIASGATVNDTDANLLNRANHTGAQEISTVTGLQSALDGKATTADLETKADSTATATAIAETLAKTTTAVDTFSDLNAANTIGAIVTVARPFSQASAVMNSTSTWRYDSTGDRADHNGITVIDPTAAVPSDYTVTEFAAWFDHVGSGSGVWSRLGHEIYPRSVGAIQKPFTEASASEVSDADTTRLIIQAMMDVCASEGAELHGDGYQYRATGQFIYPEGLKIRNGLKLYSAESASGGLLDAFFRTPDLDARAKPDIRGLTLGKLSWSEVGQPDGIRKASGIVIAGQFENGWIDDLLVDGFGGDIDDTVGGQAAVIALWDMISVNNPRSQDATDKGGAGGFRWCGGRNTRITNGNIEGGDDALQMVPLGNPDGEMFNLGFENCAWVNSTGISTEARCCIVALDPNLNEQASVKASSFEGITGEGAKRIFVGYNNSGVPAPLSYRGSGGAAKIGVNLTARGFRQFSSEKLHDDGITVLSPADVVEVYHPDGTTHASYGEYTITGYKELETDLTLGGTFDAGASTFTALGAINFDTEGYENNDYICFSGTTNNGANYQTGTIFRVTSVAGAVLTLDPAPTNENFGGGAGAAVTNKVTLEIDTANNGIAPDGSEIRRVNRATCDLKARVNLVDSAGSPVKQIQSTYAYNLDSLDIDLTVEQPYGIAAHFKNITNLQVEGSAKNPREAEDGDDAQPVVLIEDCPNAKINGFTGEAMPGAAMSLRVTGASTVNDFGSVWSDVNDSAYAVQLEETAKYYAHGVRLSNDSVDSDLARGFRAIDDSHIELRGCDVTDLKDRPLGQLLALVGNATGVVNGGAGWPIDSGPVTLTGSPEMLQSAHSTLFSVVGGAVDSMTVDGEAVTGTRVTVPALAEFVITYSSEPTVTATRL